MFREDSAVSKTLKFRQPRTRGSNAEVDKKKDMIHVTDTSNNEMKCVRSEVAIEKRDEIRADRTP